MFSFGYDGKQFQLVDAETGLPVDKGAELVDFRGDPAVLAGGRAPHKPASSGHVSTKHPDIESGSESYAGVYGLKWVEVK